jgi:hypothetical protein
MGEGRGVYRVLVGRPEGKRPLGRSCEHTDEPSGSIKTGYFLIS